MKRQTPESFPGGTELRGQTFSEGQPVPTGSVLSLGHQRHQMISGFSSLGCSDLVSVLTFWVIVGLSVQALGKVVVS